MEPGRHNSLAKTSLLPDAVNTCLQDWAIKNNQIVLLVGQVKQTEVGVGEEPCVAFLSADNSPNELKPTGLHIGLFRIAAEDAYLSPDPRTDLGTCIGAMQYLDRMRTHLQFAFDISFAAAIFRDRASFEQALPPDAKEASRIILESIGDNFFAPLTPIAPEDFTKILQRCNEAGVDINQKEIVEATLAGSLPRVPILEVYFDSVVRSQFIGSGLIRDLQDFYDAMSNWKEGGMQNEYISPSPYLERIHKYYRASLELGQKLGEVETSFENIISNLSICLEDIQATLAVEEGERIALNEKLNAKHVQAHLHGLIHEHQIDDAVTEFLVRHAYLVATDGYLSEWVNSVDQIALKIQKFPDVPDSLVARLLMIANKLNDFREDLNLTTRELFGNLFVLGETSFTQRNSQV